MSYVVADSTANNSSLCEVMTLNNSANNNEQLKLTDNVTVRDRRRVTKLIIRISMRKTEESDVAVEKDEQKVIFKSRSVSQSI